MREFEAGGPSRLYHLGKCVWVQRERVITRYLGRMGHWQITVRTRSILQDCHQELKFQPEHPTMIRLWGILTKATKARRAQGYSLEDPQHSDDPYHRPRRIDAIKVSAVKGPDTDDHYCMLDSGANVTVIPWKDNMKGDPTMCALVGNNQAEGLIVARLNTQNRTHLIVAVQDAKPHLPIFYLIQTAKYRGIWRMVGEKDCIMKDISPYLAATCSEELSTSS